MPSFPSNVNHNNNNLMRCSHCWKCITTSRSIVFLFSTKLSRAIWRVLPLSSWPFCGCHDKDRPLFSWSTRQSMHITNGGRISAARPHHSTSNEVICHVKVVMSTALLFWHPTFSVNAIYARNVLTFHSR